MSHCNQVHSRDSGVKTFAVSIFQIYFCVMRKPCLSLRYSEVIAEMVTSSHQTADSQRTYDKATHKITNSVPTLCYYIQFRDTWIPNTEHQTIRSTCLQNFGFSPSSSSQLFSRSNTFSLLHSAQFLLWSGKNLICFCLFDSISN